jgi:hypothetical protein
MRSVEHQVQVAICNYLDLRGFCYWAVPNGEKRNIITAKKLKAEGVKAGVPDITLIYDGLYYGIEIKKPKTDTPQGYLSQNQKDRIRKIKKAGGEIGIARSVQDVIELLIEWKI